MITIPPLLFYTSVITNHRILALHLWHAVQATPKALGWGASPARLRGWHSLQFPVNGGCGESIADGCSGYEWHTVHETIDIGKWQLVQ